MPSAECLSNVEVFLNSSGVASVGPSQIRSGSSFCPNFDLITVSPSAVTCNHIPSTPITLTISNEASGDEDSCETTIIVKDSIPPLLELDPPSEIYLTGSAVDLSLHQFGTYSDNCGAVSEVITPPSLTCADAGKEVLITVEVNDGFNTALQEVSLKRVVFADRLGVNLT